MMLTTTLEQIHAHSPCKNGWRKLCKNLDGIKRHGAKTPITMIQILESNGLDDALWCLRACDGHEPLAREFACWCALRVIDLWDAPKVVRDYLISGGHETRAAAWAAAISSWAAAREAAWDAAWDAAWAAARAAQEAQFRVLLADQGESCSAHRTGLIQDTRPTRLGPSA